MTRPTDKQLIDSLNKTDEEIQELLDIIKAADPNWTDGAAFASMAGGAVGVLDEKLSPGARFLSAVLAIGGLVGEIALVNDRGKRAREAKEQLVNARDIREAIVNELKARGYNNVV